MYKIGIDLGGTKIEIAALDSKNQLFFRKRIPTEQEKGYEAIIERINQLYREALAEIHQQPHTIGIGVPGAISGKTGLIKNSNTLCLIGKPLKQDLQSKLGRPIEVQNDANCFTMAEALLGAGVGKQLVFGVIMGTGCGGGISFDGKVHAGIQGIAGEWGHMQIDPAGPECYCGKRGCVELYISGGGLQHSYKERFGTFKTLQEITGDFRAGEPRAKEFFLEFIDHFGIAMSNVISLLDPDVVILGGGLSNIDELYSLGWDAVARHIFSDSLETPIVKNKLGDSAGVLGAAMIGI